MPDEGLTENISKPEASMEEHTKKVMIMQWHPSAEYTLSSASLDGTVKLWDVKSERSTMNYQIGGGVQSLRWNQDGSLLGAINKDKKMHLFDPRSEGNAMVGNGHEGSKPQSLNWVGNTGKLITVGTDSFSERQYGIFDSRDLSKPLVMKKLDNNNLPMFSHFDSATNLLFVVNKGQLFTQFFFY
mmetsp:Transcript_16610/g.25603  ORF Transcript_16610/g.25603 Transcript_16610/m.25603 type:complete len:185 (-) Transcript_16610:1041-1595(-)